jgi:hypothetical protein
MDHNVNAAAHYFDAEDSASESACNEEAHRNGFTANQADLCEDGALNCGACPFRKATAGVASTALLETITWHPVSPTTMPDGDITVQLFDEAASEPVWPGYFDGEKWLYIDGNTAHPTYYAQMSIGPVAPAAAKKAP